MAGMTVQVDRLSTIVQNDLFDLDNPYSLKLYQGHQFRLNNRINLNMKLYLAFSTGILSILYI